MYTQKTALFEDLVYKMVLVLHENKDSDVPKPVWVVSKDYMDKAVEIGDEFVKEHATVHAHRPRSGSIVICTHDSAGERYSGSWFDIVCFDEAGVIPLIQEVCLPALAMRMAKSMGDRLYATWHSGVGPHRP